ncbi:RpiB/LacA/LacB family sugar-phosphate isomerase [Pasteurella multocida]|nr:RpiB/LacA/LacB family sugar-phosphate isomerase [Pasteurella multocida]MDA5608994.1 RpiB/LacA/LacB family sugar-phosphate isomerase [Pasteurella multocida subsp. multocida]MDA5616515.1 RpiB/LacA/LacB family sugar-phosphate isomerase [Pasteurella multocida]MDA5626534.1 RpiB/LacA/LacB family sugar-phosphate isomerase [Pasteurella multocida]
MKIAIGCDDAAYNLKVELIKFLTSLGIECDDFGAGAGDTTLYPSCECGATGKLGGRIASLY